MKALSEDPKCNFASPYMKNLGNPSSNDEGVGQWKQSSCIRDEASKLKNKGA